MRSMFFAFAAVLAHFQPLLQSFLVLVGIKGRLADRAFQPNHVVLGHSVKDASPRTAPGQAI